MPGELANTATEDAIRVGAVSMALIVGAGAAVGLRGTLAGGHMHHRLTPTGLRLEVWLLP